MRKLWKKYEKWIRYAAILVIAGLCLWNAHSLVTGEIGTMFVPREIHEDYYAYRKWINAQDEYFRVLAIPVPSKWMVYTNLHPKASLVDLVRGDWSEFSLPAVDGHPEKNERKWLSPLEQDFSDRLLDLSAIKYVVVPRDDPENADDFFGAYGKRDVFLAHLNALGYLKRIGAGTGDVVVYENAGARDHIYITREEETLENTPKAISVSIQSANPSEYRIEKMENGEGGEENDGMWVYFSENFHPDWKIHVGNFSWTDVIWKKGYFLDDAFHTRSDAGLNAFFLPPEVVDRWEAGESMTIYFRPQAYLQLGLRISGAVFLGCVLFLAFIFWKKKNRARIAKEELR